MRNMINMSPVTELIIFLKSSRTLFDKSLKHICKFPRCYYASPRLPYKCKQSAFIAGNKIICLSCFSHGQQKIILWIRRPVYLRQQTRLTRQRTQLVDEFACLVWPNAFA